MLNMPLTNEHKLTARTAREVVEEFTIVVAKLATSGHKFRDRKISIEGVLSSVLLWFVRQPYEVQERLIAEWTPQLEQILGEPTSTQPGSRSTSRPVRVLSVHDLPDAEQKPPGSLKKHTKRNNK